MKFKELSIVDKRNILTVHETKNYATRPVSAITTLVVHHSLTKSGSAEAFARYHVETNGWPGIGYHFVIEKDGTICWCNDLNVKSYHVGKFNKSSLGICLVGDFRTQIPTEAQVTSLHDLLKALMADFNITVDNIKGHSELPGYSWKPCPVISVEDIREQVAGTREVNSNSIVILDTTPEKDTYYTVKHGDTIWQIAEEIGNTTVKDILVLNPGLNPKRIRVGDKIKIS